MKKVIALLLLISIALFASVLLAQRPIFNLENHYDDDGYWDGCPKSGSTCAKFP